MNNKCLHFRKYMGVYAGIDDNEKRYYNIGERLWKYSGIRKRNVEVQKNDRKQRMRDENK